MLNRREKYGLLTTLYFSQGLPFGFFAQALPVILRDEGVSLSKIGLSSMLALPWALKFLWAPWVDSTFSKRFGRRRTWIIPLQIACAAVLLLISFVGFSNITLLLVASLLINLLSATQDIATDGLALDMLAKSERGVANGIQVAGYRIGMIIGGGFLLILLSSVGPQIAFLLMAVMTVLASLPIFVLDENTHLKVHAETRQRPKIRGFLNLPNAFSIIAVILLYKVGDAFATSMLRPFLKDQGLSYGDLGWLLGVAGFIAGLAGALIGGFAINKLGRKKSLILFGGFQALSLFAYSQIATMEPNMMAFYIACSFEHMAGGMASAALFTCMMDWCRSDQRATDYTIQASMVVVATGVAGVFSGFSAETVGYSLHFLFAGLLCLVGMVVVQLLFPADASDSDGTASKRRSEGRQK